MRTTSWVRIPALTPEQALLIVELLDVISAALWDTYGDDMVNIIATAEALPPEPPDPADPADDIPF